MVKCSGTQQKHARQGIYFGWVDQPAEEINFILLHVAGVLILFYGVPAQLAD